MSASLNCRRCGGRHKARTDKFPSSLVLKADKSKIVGVICKKCVTKEIRAAELAGQQHPLAFRPSLGMGVH